MRAVLSCSACVVSITRLNALYIMCTGNDAARDNGAAAVLSSIEVNVGIICASLPPLRSTIVRMLNFLFPKLDSTPASSATWQNAIFVQPEGVKHAEAGDEMSLKGSSQRSSNSLEDGMAFSSCRTGILRSVTTTVTEEERRASAWRRPSLTPIDKIWDGGDTSKTWVNV